VCVDLDIDCLQRRAIVHLRMCNMCTHKCVRACMCVRMCMRVCARVRVCV